MKQKVADYIADALYEKGIRHVFSVVGGGAMHLNNAFGCHPKLKCIYNHHEQASAIAAESYARINGDVAVACVTTGPGGTNAVTGVLCGYQDNIPMLIISGQVRYNTTVESTGLNLRIFGEQEYNIVKSVEPMTKYAVMVREPENIRYHLEKALYLAQEGRKGPCWLDIPLDVQSAEVETDTLRPFIPPNAPKAKMGALADDILAAIKAAGRPVILAGSGVKAAGCTQALAALVQRLGVPVLCPTSTCDIFPTSYPLYFGNFGTFGGRPGNFILQNADLFVSLGCRLSFKQTGFNFEAFAPKAKKLVVDVDPDELKKNTIHIDFPVCADVKDVIGGLLEKAGPADKMNPKWLPYCRELKEKYPIYQPHQANSEKVNPYYLAQRLKAVLPDDAILVVGNSCASVSFLQMGVEKQGQLLYGNVNCGTMGYDLPAAIGAEVASRRPVFCLTGDGSIQMNLQELQTIVHNRLPVKIVVFSNGGYQAIVQTQTNFFEGHLSGCTNDSGISFPDFEKLAAAYGIPFRRIASHDEVDPGLAWLVGEGGYALCEVMQDTLQPIEPKVMSRKLEDGSIYSPPLDDLAPFLPKEVYDYYKNYDFG
ncbi:MAG: thiamine pyrophosphate-binding protein [Oscillospiraceae bacterium]